MTSDSDHPIEIAITEAARAMTAHAAPDLRARVAARRDRSAPVVRWWQPVLAASAIALAVLAWWSVQRSAPPPPPREVVVAKTAPTVPPPVTTPPALTRRRAPRHAPAADLDVWPTTDSTVAPLDVPALHVDAIDMLPNDPITPAIVEPLAMDSIEFAPLDSGDKPQRRQ